MQQFTLGGLLLWMAGCGLSPKTGGPCAYEVSERRLAIDSAKALEGGGVLYAATELLWWEGERRVIEIPCDSAYWVAYERQPKDSVTVAVSEITEGTCTPFSFQILD